MDLYPDWEQIQGWIEWTRTNLPGEGDIPFLDWGGPEIKTEQRDDAASEGKGAENEKPPWMGEITELLEEEALGGSEAPREATLDAFARAASAEVLDLAPRFTGLHFYYNLAAEDWPEWSMYKKDLFESAQTAFRRDLRTMVGMLPVEECSHDWRRIKWEISNALAAKDWDRAGQLFRLAEAFCAAGDSDLWALRGQLSFFRAFDKDQLNIPGTHFWLLSVNPPDIGVGSPLVLGAYEASLVRAPKQIFRRKLDPTVVETARDARNDLEKALQRRSDLGPSYHAMLGACQLALGDYAHAAQEYSTVLKCEVTFRRFILLDFVRAVVKEGGGEAELDKRMREGDLSAFFKDFKPNLLQVLAKSYAHAGEPTKAETVYQAWEKEYPNDPLMYLQLSEFFAQKTQYKEAYQALRKAVELKPELEEEPAYKIALPLGAIAAEQFNLDQLTREAIKEHPEIENLLDLLLADIWPTYAKLGPEVRGPWRSGSIQTYYLPFIQPASAAGFRQIGALKFAQAVEIELRQRVFEAFKKETSANRSVRAAAEEALEDKKAGTFARFLVRRGRLTLGEMEFVIREAMAGKGGLFNLLDNWIRPHFPKLDHAQRDALKRICVLRNIEAHAHASFNVNEVPALARGVLDALLATIEDTTALSR